MQRISLVQIHYQSVHVCHFCKAIVYVQTEADRKLQSCPQPEQHLAL